jgi:hypothetical protein
MTLSASRSRLPCEFDDFLYAPIGEDGDGRVLSVLSALARLDLDPWREAANLARLPGETATERLASLVAKLPDGQSPHREPGSIAVRLIALLPRPPGSDIPPRAMLLGAGANSLSIIHMIVIGMIFMAFVLGTQWIVASLYPPARADSAHRAPASSTVSPNAPPPSAARSHGGRLG